MSTPASALVPALSIGEILSRMQYNRTVGFQGFVANKAFVVSDAVPKGKVRAIYALSAFRSSASVRILHFFAIPPQVADSTVNLSADGVSPIFGGANNNAPLTAGVLVSVGGGSGLTEMQTVNSSSVNGSLDNFALPERWKILCFIDSGEVVTNPAADGITLDMAFVDFDYCECLPDGLL